MWGVQSFGVGEIADIVWIDLRSGLIVTPVVERTFGALVEVGFLDKLDPDVFAYLNSSGHATSH